jgi:carboxymethylenebutenolidase
MRSESITVETADGPMRCYEAVAEDARAGIVVIQEAFGVNAYIEDVVRRLAESGYHAVAPDLFHRSGGGTADYGDWDTVMTLFASVTGDRDLLVDVDAALDHLRGRGFADTQLGIVGFCFGGRVSFLVALERAIGAAVGFYGGGIVTGRFPQFPTLVERAASLQTPWLGLFGDEDPSIPVDDVERLRRALTTATVDTEIVRYAGAAHGFHCDVRDAYHEGAATDAWARALDWFGRRR